MIHSAVISVCFPPTTLKQPQPLADVGEWKFLRLALVSQLNCGDGENVISLTKRHAGNCITCCVCWFSLAASSIHIVHKLIENRTECKSVNNYAHKRLHKRSVQIELTLFAIEMRAHIVKHQNHRWISSSLARWWNLFQWMNNVCKLTTRAQIMKQASSAKRFCFSPKCALQSRDFNYLFLELMQT